MEKEKFYVPAVDLDNNQCIIVGEGFVQGNTAQGHFIDYIGDQQLSGSEDMWKGEHTFKNVCLTREEAEKAVDKFLEENRVEEKLEEIATAFESDLQLQQNKPKSHRETTASLKKFAKEHFQFSLSSEEADKIANQGEIKTILKNSKKVKRNSGIEH